VGIIEMRAHYGNYFKGLDHFKDLRMKLVTSPSYDEINEIFAEIIGRYSTALA
jgi:tRNA-dihydrouridine synthase B